LKIGVISILLLLTLISGATIIKIAVAQRSSVITFTADQSLVAKGSPVTLSGFLTDGVNSSGIRNVTVTIWYRAGTSGPFSNLTSRKTDPLGTAGQYSFSWMTNNTGVFNLKANWTGGLVDSTTYTPAESSIITVTVRLASIVTFSANQTLVPSNGTVALSGKIQDPENANAMFPNVDVTIRFAMAGNNSVLATVPTNFSSQYSYDWQTTEVGEFKVQSSWSGNDTYMANTSTGVLTVYFAVVQTPYPTIYVENPMTVTSNFIFFTNTTAVGDRFNATVWVKNVTDLFDYSVDLRVNDTVLNITRAWRPTFDTQWVFRLKNTVGTTPALIDADPFNGIVEEATVGDSLIPPTTYFSGMGKLAIVEFQILLPPPKGAPMGTVFSSLNISTRSTYIENPEGPFEIWSIKTNGQYEFNYAPPGTQISINVNPATVSLGQTVTISGKIQDALGNTSLIYPGETVRIWHRAGTTGTFTNIANATTNGTSGYSYPWPSVGAGLHQFNASWAGNASYTGSESIIANVTVNKLTSVITINADPTSVQVGADVTITGTLTAGTPRVGATVTISYRRQGETTFTAFPTTATTVAGGTYSYVWTTTTAGTFELKASWAGDDTYAADESPLATVEVAAPPMDYLPIIIAAVVIIIIVVIIVIYFLRKRSKAK